MEGTNKAHENGEAMGFVGVRLTAQLGDLSLGMLFLLASRFALPPQGINDLPECS